MLIVFHVVQPWTSARETIDSANPLHGGRQICFCKVLSGFPQSFESLIHEDTRPCDKRLSRIDPSVAFDVVPALSDVVASFARFKNGKAWGSPMFAATSSEGFLFRLVKPFTH